MGNGDNGAGGRKLFPPFDFSQPEKGLLKLCHSLAVARPRRGAVTLCSPVPDSRAAPLYHLYHRAVTQWYKLACKAKGVYIYDYLNK